MKPKPKPLNTRLTPDGAATYWEFIQRYHRLNAWVERNECCLTYSHIGEFGAGNKVKLHIFNDLSLDYMEEIIERPWSRKRIAEAMVEVKLRKGE